MSGDPLHCCRCGDALTSMFYGMGDGTGQRFGCPHCYWREMAENYYKRLAKLESAMASAREALFIAWTQGDVAVSRPAHGALILLDDALSPARARGAVGEGA